MARQGFRPLSLVVAILITAPAVTWLEESARADSVTPVSSAVTLPSPVFGTGAVWTGTHALVFGGANSDQIVRFDPSGPSVTTLATRLPSNRSGAATVWTGSEAYLIGGYTTGYSRTIVRYDPATETATTLATQLPAAREGASGAWLGGSAYIFGGTPNGLKGSESTTIYRFDPSAGTVATMAARLPTPAAGTTAVAVGPHVYVFGGLTFVGATGDTLVLDTILRYDPSTDTMVTLPTPLPEGRYGASAVWDGSHIYLFGGFDPVRQPVADILRFEPATGSVVTTGAALPTPRGDTSAVWDGSHAYVFGGEDAAASLHQIVRYDPATDDAMPLSPFPRPLQGIATVWTGSRILVFGGGRSIFEYDRSTDQATSPAALHPHYLSSPSAFWDGQAAFVLGGFGSGAERGRQIWRYDPASASYTKMMALLPRTTVYAPAIWDGDVGYLFGGADYSQSVQSYHNQIVRYDPATDTAVPVPAVLPSARAGASVVWTGTYAYIFGGFANQIIPEIVRFDPARNEVKVMTTQLPPIAGFFPHAVWDGRHAYLFSLDASVLRYDPEADTLTTMSATVPGGHLLNGGAVWTGREALLLGGSHNDVLRYTGEPSVAPSALAATHGTELGRVALSWIPPPDTTYFGPLSYRVYRGASAGDLALLGTTTTPGFTDTGPLIGTARYCVSAVTPSGEGPCTELLPVRTPDAPSAPRALVATRGAIRGEIQLAWQPPADLGGAPITAYRIYRGDTSGAGTLVAETGPELAFTDTGLPDAALRYYRVAAVNEAGEGALSNEAAATTPSVPSAPEGLVATRGPGRGEITLRWSPPADDGGLAILAYRVQRGGTSGTETFHAEVGATLTYTDGGSPDGQRWYYLVSAVNAVGEGAQSGEATSLTPTLPSAPRTLAATRGPGRGEISLSWAAPLDTGGGALSYRIYRGTVSGGETFLAEVAARSFRDTGIPDGATRWYRVSAVGPVGESDMSNEVSAMAPTVATAPRDLTALPAAATDLDRLGAQLSWVAPQSSGGAIVTSYRIYRTDADGAERLLAQVTARTYLDRTCVVGDVCRYQVAALNIVGEGPRSNEGVTTGTAPP